LNWPKSFDNKNKNLPSAKNPLPSNPMKNETDEITKEKRLLDGETIKLLKKAAKKENVSADSMLWLLVDVFSSGKIKSRAFHDAPACVKNDGLIQEKDSGHLNFLAWELTEKAAKILAKR
jgi:hypothetical protein